MELSFIINNVYQWQIIHAYVTAYFQASAEGFDHWLVRNTREYKRIILFKLDSRHQMQSFWKDASSQRKS